MSSLILTGSCWVNLDMCEMDWGGNAAVAFVRPTDTKSPLFQSLSCRPVHLTLLNELDAYDLQTNHWDQSHIILLDVLIYFVFSRRRLFVFLVAFRWWGVELCFIVLLSQNSRTNTIPRDETKHFTVRSFPFLTADLINKMSTNRKAVLEIETTKKKMLIRVAPLPNPTDSRQGTISQTHTHAHAQKK